MKKARFLSLLIAAAMLLTMCFSGAAIAEEKTTVVLWCFAETHARYFEHIGAEYAAKVNPNFVLDVQLMGATNINDRLAVVVSAGGEGAPDLVDLEQGQFPRYMKEETMCLIPIDDLIERDGIGDNLVMNRLDLYAWNGQHYGLEHALCPVQMIYRPDLFEQCGLEIPTTWEEYKECAKVFKENGIYIAAINDMYSGVPGLFEALTLASGNDIVTAEGTFQLTDEYMALLDEFRSMQLDGYFFPYEADADKYYETSENRIATDFVADWGAGWLNDNVPEQSGMWRMTYLPKLNDTAMRASTSGGTGLCMCEYTTNDVELLWDFMKFAMVDTENCITKYEMVSLYPPVYSAMEGSNTPVEYYGGQNLGELWQEVAPETPSRYQAAFRADFNEIMGVYRYDWMDGNMTTEEYAEAVKADMAARMAE